MRKLFLMLLIIPLTILTGCSDTTTDDDGNIMTARFAPNFSSVCRHTGVEYLRDVDTNIMYIYRGVDKYSGLSVYYNSEGEPMTYVEFQHVHTEKYHNS